MMTSKTILLAVCGLAPQVITETIYALLLQGRAVDAIRIFTTRKGKLACNEHLLNPEDGQYYRLLSEYGIERAKIDFSPRHVIAVANRHGQEIDDIATEEDNELFLKACMEAVFAATGDPGSTVYFSVAGGRKTMGACLALAAQFYGRPQDRIFHVLVTPEFERNRDFFYPPRDSRSIQLRDDKGQPFFKETKFAEITLAAMPFISVRDRLSSNLLQAPEDPATLMLSLVRETRHELRVNIKDKKVIWKGAELDLPPAQLALYAFFAMHKQDAQCDEGACRDCDDCFLTIQEILDRQADIARLYNRILKDRVLEEMSEGGITSLDQPNFGSFKSKIKQNLERAFGPYESKLLEIATRGQRPGVRYGITLEKKRIRVEM